MRAWASTTRLLPDARGDWCGAGVVATVRRGGGLLGPAAGWPGRVVYVVGVVAGQAVLMQAWLAAEHLTAAGGCSRPARSAGGSGSARMAGVAPFGVVAWVGSVRMPSEAS